jgi:hypothetical protein
VSRAPFFNLIAGIQFEVSGEHHRPNGTLSDDFVIDYDYIHRSDSNPNIYVTRLQNFRYLRPGHLYYFQFSGYTYGGDFTASPIFYFVYDPAAGAPATGGGPDLSMSRGNAVHYLRYLIKHKTGRRASRLATSCKSAGASAFNCRARFRSGHRRYAGRFHVEHFQGGDGNLYWRGVFKGHRADGTRVAWTV